MSVRDLSWKALLFGCLVTFVTWSVLVILSFPIEMILSDLILEPPWTNDGYEAEFMVLHRWLARIFDLVGTLVSFGLGGYFAAKMAKSQFHLHSILVVLLVLLYFWVTATDPNLVEVALTSVIAVLVGLLGSRMAIRAKLVKGVN